MNWVGQPIKEIDMHMFLVEKLGYTVGATCVHYFSASAVDIGTLDTIIIGRRKASGALVRFILPLCIALPFLACLYVKRGNDKLILCFTHLQFILFLLKLQVY